MIIVFISFVFFVIVFLSKKYLSSWYNHISLYSFVWSITYITSQLDIIFFKPIEFLTYLVLISASISFLVGSFIPIMLNNKIINNKLESGHRRDHIFNSKTIYSIIIICSLISIIDTFLFWNQLFDKFGSLARILINMNVVYSLRVQGEINEVVPYLNTLSYVAIFFGAIYSVQKRRIVLITIIPFISVALKSVASVGRLGIVFALIEFVAVFLIYNNYYIKNKLPLFKKKKGIIVSIAVIFVFIVSAATLVKELRASGDNFEVTRNEREKLRSTLILSPGVYFYFSSQINVLNEFLKESKERPYIGENTFMPIYSILAKFNIVEQPTIYQTGYLTPTWSNTGTYLRELLVDFGPIIGVIFIPFLFGLIGTILHNKFKKNGDPIVLLNIVYLHIVLGCSFFIMATRSSILFISYLIILLLLLLLKKVLFLETNSIKSHAL